MCACEHERCDVFVDVHTCVRLSKNVQLHVIVSKITRELLALINSSLAIEETVIWITRFGLDLTNIHVVVV